MQKFFSVVFMGWLLAMASQVWAQDVGSAACRQVQLTAQAAVDGGGPFKNHGALVSTAAAVVNPAAVAGEITTECASCIMNQFAHGIAIAAQTDCGGPDCGNCFTTRDNPGCEVAACQAAVCAGDPFCCTGSWDLLCAGEAVSLCGNSGLCSE